ncbi:MAG: hypothetical protein N2508_06170 [Anaerolineae bacterium]|nr:hypothetical protein [Anaerolineae bacterium]
MEAEKYRLTLESKRALSRAELAEIYDMLLEQAALKARTEPQVGRESVPQHEEQTPDAGPTETIRVSNDLLLEVWPRGSSGTPPLVTLWSLGQDPEGERLGVVVIWQSELLPLIAALTRVAVILSGEQS